MQDVVGGGDGVAGYWGPGRQAVTAWRGPVVVRQAAPSD